MVGIGKTSWISIYCISQFSSYGFFFFFFFFPIFIRLSARISDFENVLLMVHVVGYMLAPQAHGTQLFFFQRPILTFLGRLSTHLSISSSPELF